MKVAYFCEPQVGGTFTYFQRLRPALAARGIDFRCIPPVSGERFAKTPYANEDGVDFLSLSDSLPAATRQVIEYLEREQFRIVMVLPGAAMLSSALPYYLPRTLRCVIRVPMMTRGAYVPTQALAPHLDRVYAVSDRIADDLVGRYHLSPAAVEVVYHGVQPISSDDVLEHKSSTGPVRLLYAGRLYDIDKGVFLLPRIMKSLCASGVNVHLAVAGGGPDAAELARRFQVAGVQGSVSMLGPLSHDKLNAEYRKADVFVFPSRFEGCGFAALEAMAAACAPVLADIRGSLRVLAADGAAGKLARVGDAEAFARAIGELARDRAELRRYQLAARDRVLDRFTLERMADQMARSFRSIPDSPDLRQPARPLDDYKIPAAFKPTWRTLVPRPIKNWLRTQMERRGWST